MRVITLIAAIGLLIAVPGVSGQSDGEEGKSLTAEAQLEIIDSVTSQLNYRYVFPEVAKRMEDRLRDLYQKHAYEGIRSTKEFVQALTRNLREVYHDWHLLVLYYPDSLFETEIDQEPDEEELARRRTLNKHRNFSFRRVERLPGNVGYLKFDQFVDAKEAAPTAIAALNFLGNCDALIIDLRDNGGGEPSMIKLLMSYFFDEETHFNSLVVRYKGETNQLRTQAYVPGPRLSKADIYVLLSYDTFSAAEDMAYNLKHAGRATLVGARTPGGAHGCEFHNIRSLNIQVKIPCERAVSPFTDSNWQDVGVEPDIEVPSYKAFDVAYLEAVKKLREKATDEDAIARLDWILPVLEANLRPVIVGEETLKGYVGEYGPVTTTHDHGSLFAQLPKRRPMKLLAMSETMFRCEWHDEWRLEFHPNEKGIAGSVTAFMADGRVFNQNRR